MLEPGERLILYETGSCPYCVVVRRTIDRLAIPVERRNILEDGVAREELLAARGRRTVPVLRRISSDGADTWMPESRDIVRYLEARWASAAVR